MTLMLHRGAEAIDYNALRELETAARAEGNPGVAAFADRLVMHARNEEDVLYPAAILVGDILKARGIS